MKNVVISLGGSVVLSDDLPSSYFHDLSAIIEKQRHRFKIYIVVGGGKPARSYIRRGRQLHLSETFLDELGIAITRVNALLLSRLLPGTNATIPLSTDEALHNVNPVVIMGGTTPGHSTDFVSAELAMKAKAEYYIIATNVDGVYNKDPHNYKDAELFTTVSIHKLIEQQGIAWESAGKNVVIDGPALRIIKEAKLPTYVLNGKHLDRLDLLLAGQSFHGTRITH
jgi:uridylate kinase